MKLRSLLALLALLVMSLPSTTSAAHSPDAEVVLAGENTISARASGSILVELPEDVTLPLKTRHRSPEGPAPWLTFDGDGRIVALFLLRHGDPGRWYENALRAVRFRSCRTCDKQTSNSLGVADKVFHGKATLDAGLYDLYVITDGEPVTVSLQLAGLEGSNDIAVGEPVDAAVKTPSPRLEETGGPTVYWAGQTYPFEGPLGMMLIVNVMRDPSYHGAWFDYCYGSDYVYPDEVERVRCTPFGGNHLHSDLARIVQRSPGGYTLTSFIGLHNQNDGIFNGDSRRQYFSYRLVSPGPMKHLWSQAVVFTF